MSAWDDLFTEPEYTPEPSNYVEQSSANPAQAVSFDDGINDAVANAGQTSGPSVQQALNVADVPAEAAPTTGGDLLSWATSSLSDILDFGKSVLSGTFMSPEKTVANKDGTTTTTGGGINDLSKILIASAIQSIGQGQVLKWQTEREEKESARNRKERREDRDEAYRRKAFGSTNQLTARKGLLKGAM